jgi:phenylacetate-CoA ligase
MKDTMYLHPEMETLTRPEIEKLQLERLQKTVRHCMNSPFYKKRFEDNHLKPEDIRSLNDLRKIPFTTKQDLRDTYPFGMAAVPLEKAVRLHSSSGTTGNPTVILHTQKDLDEWANAVARCLYMVGLVISSKTLPATECLPADSVFNTERNAWECLPFPLLPETPKDN